MGTHTQDVTVVGWVGSDLRTYHLDGVGGVPYTQFRLASTRRVLDRQSGTFRDGPTLWFTVKAWRATAVNLEASLAKGDPVVVVGRLGQSEWVAQDGAPRSELVLEALAVGHDLGYGTTKFRRTLSGPRRPREDAAVDQGPVDVSVLAEEPDVPDAGFTDDPWATAGPGGPTGEEPAVDEADVVEDQDADGRGDGLGADAVLASAGTRGGKTPATRG